MNELTKYAKVMMIGAGIMGNIIAFHLVKLGWENLVMIDKGPLPNIGELRVMHPILYLLLTISR